MQRMVQDIVIVGAGGCGREALMVVRAIDRAATRASEPAPWNFIGFLATPEPDRAVLDRIEAPYLGRDDDEAVLGSLSRCRFVAAIGDSAARRQVIERFEGLGLGSATLVHPSVVTEDDLRLGDGSMVFAGSILSTNVSIGRGVLVNKSCTVSHDAQLGDFATLSPSVSITGYGVVGEGATMGTQAAMLPRTRIGSRSVVGAGAVVTKDIPDDRTAVGVPARLLDR
jgi:sugar O-acyltransferase (sialic acid O-acetyltransferase NeuD family)